MAKNNSNNNNKTEEDLVNKTFSTTAADDTANNSTSVKLRRDFESATLTDVALDNKGKPMAVWNWPWNEKPLKNGLRCLARALDFAGLQQRRKDEIIKATIRACSV